VASQQVQVRPQLVERSLGRSIVQSHMGDSGQVDVGPFELTDCGSKDLPLFAFDSLRRHLDDRVAHKTKLGRRV
jgi:hypothetical protein